MRDMRKKIAEKTGKVLNTEINDLQQLEQCDEFYEDDAIEPDRQAIHEGGINVVFDDNLSLGPYDILMTKVDISKGEYGQNLFYKMQVLH